MKRTKILTMFLAATLLTGNITNAVQFSTIQNVKGNKVWTVTFNQKLDYLNKNAVMVLDEAGNEHEIEVYSKGNKVYIKPLENYEEGKKYTIKIDENITRGKVLDDRILMDFIVEDTALKEENKPIEENKPVESNVFLREDLSDYFTTEWARVEGEELIFNYGNTFHKDEKIKNKMIPNLNKKMYEMTKYLLENNEYGNYIKTHYTSAYSVWGDSTGIIVEGSKEHATYKYSIHFEDERYRKYTDSVMNIELRHFGDSEKFSEGVKKGLPDKELEKIWYYDEVYIKNFKKCIEIIFNDKDYESIYNYIMQIYSYKSSNFKNEVNEKKTIDGVTIWVNHNFEKDGTNMNIYFKF